MCQKPTWPFLANYIIRSETFDRIRWPVRHRRQIAKCLMRPVIVVITNVLMDNVPKVLFAENDKWIEAFLFNIYTNLSIVGFNHLHTLSLISKAIHALSRVET
jgi:hypothetical protein